MKAVKLVFKIIGGILGVVILGTILLIAFFPTEKVKEIAIEQMQKQYHRQVKIEKVSLNILKGIIIKGVKVSDRPNFKKGTFISCRAFVLKYDLWKLLQKKLVIKKLVLEEPNIFIKRYVENKKVVFNFSDMLPPMPKKLPKKQEEPKKEIIKETKKASGPKPLPKIKKSQLPIDIQIGKVGLEGAKIEVTDTATPKFKEIYNLYNVHFLIENLNTAANTPMQIKTGFGLSVTEWTQGKKNDKDINLETAIDGAIKLFDRKGILNPSGAFILALKNGKFRGIQAYRELRNQAEDINKSISSYQEKLVKSIGKLSEQLEKNKNNLKKLGIASEKVKSYSDKAEVLSQKIKDVSTRFVSGALEWKFLKEDFQFDETKTKLKIQDSKVISDKIEVKGGDFRANGNGYTGFDTTVNYLFSLIADKKYNKNEVTEAIANDKGEIELPVTVKGTISEPKIILDKDFIINKVKAKLKEKFDEKVKSLNKEVQNLSKQYLGVASVEEAKKKLQAEAQKKIDAEKQRLAEEAKKKEEELKRKAEEEKKKQEEAAKKKLEEEAKKKLKKFGF